MMQTFDFLFQVWKSEELKNRLLTNLDMQKEHEIVIGNHTLLFDFANRTARISCSRPDYPFSCKIIPAEISFDSLGNMIRRDFNSSIDVKPL